MNVARPPIKPKPKHIKCPDTACESETSERSVFRSEPVTALSTSDASTSESPECGTISVKALAEKFSAKQPLTVLNFHDVVTKELGCSITSGEHKDLSSEVAPSSAVAVLKHRKQSKISHLVTHFDVDASRAVVRQNKRVGHGIPMYKYHRLNKHGRKPLKGMCRSRSWADLHTDKLNGIPRNMVKSWAGQPCLDESSRTTLPRAQGSVHAGSDLCLGAHVLPKSCVEPKIAPKPLPKPRLFVRSRVQSNAQCLTNAVTFPSVAQEGYDSMRSLVSVPDVVTSCVPDILPATHEYAEYDVQACLRNTAMGSQTSPSCQISLDRDEACSALVPQLQSSTAPSIMSSESRANLDISEHIYCAVRNDYVCAHDVVLDNDCGGAATQPSNSGDTECISMANTCANDDGLTKGPFMLHCISPALSSPSCPAGNATSDVATENWRKSSMPLLNADCRKQLTLAVRRRRNSSSDYEDLVHGVALVDSATTSSRDVKLAASKDTWEVDSTAGSCISRSSLSTKRKSLLASIPDLLHYKRISSPPSNITVQEDGSANLVSLSSDPSQTCQGSLKRRRLKLPRTLRPVSQQIDSKLLQLKGGIQVNIAETIGKICLKVTSKQSKESRQQRSKSTFYSAAVDVDATCAVETPPLPPRTTSITITVQTQLADNSRDGSLGAAASADVSSDEWDTEDDTEEFDIHHGATQSAEDFVLGSTAAVGQSSTSGTQDGTNSDRSVVASQQSVDRSPTESFELPLQLEPVYDSRFAFSEPLQLYQHYHAHEVKVKRIETIAGGETRAQLTERILTASGYGSQRSLWCELPEVKRRGVLDCLGDQERKCQEAMFEVISSEASYLRSLNVLITHFMADPRLSAKPNSASVVTRQERKHLFGNVMQVRDCSQRLLNDLMAVLEENVVLEDICGVLGDYIQTDFGVYVKYCSDQVYQEKAMNQLKKSNAEFLLVITDLERDSKCQNLNFRSFLMLPMQRITRFPLLIDAIYRRLQPDTPRYETAKRALALANKVVKQCNEGARAVERMEQLVAVDAQLVYREDMRRLALVNASRWVVKRGALVQLLAAQHRQGRHTLARTKLKPLYCFLFSDLFMVTKKKKHTFTVVDYCARSLVVVSSLEPSCPQVPQGAVAQIPQSRQHLFLCILMQNHKQKSAEMVFCAESETDRARWLDAFSPPQSEHPDEQIYASWDCPQVVVVQPYLAMQDDELSLQEGDVVNVLRKMRDGWCEGERLTDGERGWFHASHTTEILSDHIRAKNFRQRLRVIQAVDSLQQTSAPVVRKQSSFDRMPGMDTLRRLSNAKGSVFYM